MRLLVLGASGGVGRWATRFAASAGHEVTAFVRPATSFAALEGVRVCRGSVLDPLDLERVVVDQDAVISCIGPQRKQVWNPWSSLRLPPRVAELTVRNLLAALKSTAVRRVAAISAAGVGDSFTTTNPIMRWMIGHSTLRAMYADLTAMEAVLASSTMDWMAVRPVTLVNSAPTKRAKTISRYRASSVVGRGDVAMFLLTMATGTSPVPARTPMLGWW